jgi:predicted transglutaminase-like cysteine proteinase
MQKTARIRPIARLAGALLVAALPSAGMAQAFPTALSSLSLAKSEAILGGETSALAKLLAKQQGIPLASVRPLQPASRPKLSTIQAIVRKDTGVSPAVASGRPDLFGSIALSVSRTPLDRRWNKVERARIGGSHAAFARSLRDRDVAERIDAINRYVNGRVRFTDDSRQFGRGDVWLSASETLRRGRGDCEDYAIAKLQMLRAAGLSDDDMYLAVVKDLVRRSDHAVLVVRAGNRMLMLDNGTDLILDSEQVRDYRPVLTFAAAGSWTHGYRRTQTPVTYASADMKPVAPASAR